MVATIYHDAVATNTTMKMYLNGTEVVNDTISGTKLSLGFAEAQTDIGLGCGLYWPAPASPPMWTFNGELDESRLFAGVRSAAWLSACYENQKSDGALLTVGDMEPMMGTILIIQ